MSTLTLHRNLRRRLPALTPPWTGEDEQPRDMFDRFKIPPSVEPPDLLNRFQQDRKDPREAQLLGTMQESIKPPDATKPFPAIQPRRADISPERIQQMEREMIPEAKPIAGPMPRVHLGTSTKGLQGVERDLARVKAAREFDSEGTGFKITPDFVAQIPKDPHTDWKDRLKSMGKTAIISMANIKRANPDASAAELLAGGATGGAIGAISRDTGDAMFRRAQIEDMEAQLAPQIAREGALAKIETERQKPILEAEKVRRDEEHRQAQLEIQRAVEQGRMTRDEAQRKLEELRLKEQERHNREQERLDQERIDKPPKADDNVSKYEAAKGLLDDLSAQEQKAEQVKNAAWTAYQTAKSQAAGRTYSDGSPIPVDSEDAVVAAKKAYDEAEKEYGSFWGKKNEAKAEMKKYEPRSQGGRTIEGAISAFKTKYKRDPSEEEIARMKAALGQ